MPDPMAAKRLIEYGCKIKYERTHLVQPRQIKGPDDFRPNTRKGKLDRTPVWLVEITMPKSLMADIRTGSIELEDQSIDLEDLDSAYEEDLDQEEFKDTEGQDEQAQQSAQPAPSGQAPAL